MSDWLDCVCGNSPRSDGFHPCDENGREIEPTDAAGWCGGLYVCGRCGVVYAVAVAK